jgi:hypothetical protein
MFHDEFYFDTAVVDKILSITIVVRGGVEDITPRIISKP